MKKLTVIVFSSLLLFLLIGCENFTVNQTTEDETTIQTESKTTIPIELNPIDIVLKSIEKYDFSNSNGFDYKSVQTVDEIVTNSDEIEQRIEWLDETAKIYTEHSSLSLLEFNLDKTHNLYESVNYFYNNQIGEYDEQNNLVWQDITIDAYLDFTLPMNLLLTEYFSTYSIEEIDNQYVLTGTINTENINDVLATDQTNITNLEIIMIVNQIDHKLIEISLTYQQDISSTEIIFTPYYDDAQVIIPE